MSRLVWDAAGDRLFETGARNAVLYVQDETGAYPLGVAWNGLSSVTESPSGADASPVYADDVKYLNLIAAEEFGATIEAYTYPDEFAECDGSVDLATGVRAGQQTRKTFGLCYRTAIGNDIDGNEYGYKLHLVYGATAAPSEKAYSSINDSPEAIAFSWELSTIPIAVTDHKPTAIIVIDSTKADEDTLSTLEDILYGDVGSDPYLPLPDAVTALFASAAPNAIALSSIVPADAEPSAPINSTVVLTFNNAILREAVVVTKDDGTIVAGARSWDATNKILTFTPTEPLANAATYLVTIGGVVDIYNQALAAEVKDFTTVGA